MDALLPTASLLEQILIETDLGADLQQVARRNPAFRELARLEKLSKVPGVETVGLGVLSPSLQARHVSRLSKMRTNTRRLALLDDKPPSGAAFHRQVDPLPTQAGQPPSERLPVGRSDPAAPAHPCDGVHQVERDLLSMQSKPPTIAILALLERTPAEPRFEFL